jgi:VanZ family protein
MKTSESTSRGKPACELNGAKHEGYRLLLLSNRRILKSWLPSAIWLGVIAVESSHLGSAENTGRILYPVFHALFGMDPLRFAVWHHVLRKAGHFVGYFTLSFLLFRSWRASLPKPGTRWCAPWAMFAFLGTVLVASLDEWHQSFLSSRTGTFSDVVLDSLGGFVAQIPIFMNLRDRILGYKDPAT